jgi:hypothetical protein
MQFRKTEDDTGAIPAKLESARQRTLIEALVAQRDADTALQ